MKQVKADVILEAASKIFIKHGYNKTFMEDIAQEAKIGKGTIYHYFHSKEDIFVAILRREHEDVISKTKEKIEQAETFGEKFKIFLVEPFTHIIPKHNFVMQIMKEDSPVFLVKLNEFKTEMNESFKRNLTSIFKFGLEGGVIKPKYENDIPELVELVFRLMFDGKEDKKGVLTEDKIDELKANYLYFADILLDAITLQERE